MGLFDKKYCDFCNEKIKFLCNRKLEDGNMCSDCAKAISPLLTDRRKTTVAEMKQHLQYREANKARIQLLAGPEVLGDGNTKLYLGKKADVFAVTSAKLANFTTANPDVIDMTSVSNVETETKEHKEEIYYKDSEGNRKSYNPHRYKYSYDYVVTIYVNSEWFDKIEFNLNSTRVEQQNMVLSNKYSAMMNEINMRFGEAIRRGGNCAVGGTNGIMTPNASINGTLNGTLIGTPVASASGAMNQAGYAAAAVGMGAASAGNMASGYNGTLSPRDKARQRMSNTFHGAVIGVETIHDELLRLENANMSPWFNPMATNYFDQYLMSLMRVFDQDPTNQTIQLFVLMIDSGMCPTTQRVWMETLYFVERCLNNGITEDFLKGAFAKALGTLPADPNEAKEMFRKQIEDYRSEVYLKNMGHDPAQNAFAGVSETPVQPVETQAAIPNNSEWSCTSCGSTGNIGKFCSSCGAPRP